MQENCESISLFLRNSSVIIPCILMRYIMHLQSYVYFVHCCYVHVAMLKEQFVLYKLCSNFINYILFCVRFIILLFHYQFMFVFYRSCLLPLLPADVCTVVLYTCISYLVLKNVSISVLNSNFFSISWKHNYHLLKNPCKEKFAIFTVDGARKFLFKPITQREPITVDIMKKLYNHHGVSSDLSDLRIYCMLSLAFAGFLRFNELVSIRFADLTFFDSHVQIFIPKSKTNIFRQGNKLLNARTGKETCPVVCLENYIRISKIANKA